MRRRAAVVLALAVVLLAAACSGDDDSHDDRSASTTVAEGGSPADAAAALGPLGGPVEISLEADATICDPIDPVHCMLPFPSDFHTVPDLLTDTGRRLAFATEALPSNVDGVRSEPDEWNRQDGFSPGSPIAFWAPGVDLDASGAASLTDLAASLDEDSAVVLLDVATGERVPHWVELDSTQPEPNLVVVRPAQNFADGAHIVVGVRGLVDGAGVPIEASPAFAAYRDRLDTGDEVLEAQRDRYEQVFADLALAGMERDELVSAWDFTVASTRSLSEDMLAIRDDAFASLGDDTPAFSVTSVEPSEDPRIARDVVGTFEIPNYLEGVGGPGEHFLRDAATGLPVRNVETPTFTADFRCIVPTSALSGAPARPVVYGHGLLGSEREVASSSQRDMAGDHNMVYCATKWYGFSEDDVGQAVASLSEGSNFVPMAHRSQQGILGQLWLARLMRHPDGLGSDPAFQTDDGRAVIDGAEVFFDGNSQGGIMGGAATAVSTEWTRAVLGVPGMNYSTLLRRSTDWDTYAAIYEPAYPDPLDRTLGLYFIQILWDRMDASGYANHLTGDPLPGTPAHEVLLHVAFGDHQVSPYTADVEARTAGIPVHAPSVATGRLADVEPQWGIATIDSYPHDGSALVIWDSGAPAPPIGNEAPRTGEDPHGDPRADPAAQEQKSAFLRSDGLVVDVCGDGACQAAPTD